MASKAFAGANFSPAMNCWYPVVFDGKNVQTLEPRRTRDEAMEDARRHLDRLVYTKPPVREWHPPE